MSGYKPLSAGARQAKLLSRIGAETNKNELLEAQVLLRRAIGNELTDRQRDCVQLYYGERLTMQEIADELHLTRGTVCKHLQKLRHDFRTLCSILRSACVRSKAATDNPLKASPIVLLFVQTTQHRSQQIYLRKGLYYGFDSN